MLRSVIQDTNDRIRSGESVESVVSEKLAVAADDPFNCFITLLTDRAMQKAREVDRRIARGSFPALAGVTVVVKDNILVQDTLTTCASRILENYQAPYTATAVTHLESRGAVIIGKTNMDEFGMGSSTENSRFGHVRNPINPTVLAGGSSGGTAAAVAAGYADIGLGSDTGGSIRLPASFCGITGLKPTYGTVSRRGLVAYASSMDQIGPMTRHITDTVRVMANIAQHDPMDATSHEERTKFKILADATLQGAKIGYFDIPELLAPEVATAMDDAIAGLENAGAVVKRIQLPFSDVILPMYYLIASAEACSNLARYDGIHYGTRHRGSESLEKLYRMTRSHMLGKEVKRRIFLGTYALSCGNFETHYGTAIKLRRGFTRKMDDLFSQIDFMVCPTCPIPPFRPGEKTNDPLTMYQCDIFTVSANLGGYPAISIPWGVPEGDLPVGIQLICKRFGEEMLFNAAAVMEGFGR